MDLIGSWEKKVCVVEMSLMSKMGNFRTFLWKSGEEREMTISTTSFFRF
jgi:hypothetical protein